MESNSGSRDVILLALLYDSGARVPLIYIRNFLGHESVQTTEIYLRIHQGSVSKILKEKPKQYTEYT